MSHLLYRLVLEHADANVLLPIVGRVLLDGANVLLGFLLCNYLRRNLRQGCITAVLRLLGLGMKRLHWATVESFDGLRVRVYLCRGPLGRLDVHRARHHRALPLES